MENMTHNFDKIHVTTLQYLLTYAGLIADKLRHDAALMLCSLDADTFYSALNPSRDVYELAQAVLEKRTYADCNCDDAAHVLWAVRQLAVGLAPHFAITPEFAELVKQAFFAVASNTHNHDDARWLCDQIWHCMCHDKTLRARWVELERVNPKSQNASVSFLAILETQFDRLSKQSAKLEEGVKDLHTEQEESADKEGGATWAN